MRVVGAALMAAVMMTGAAQAQMLVRTVPPGVIVASDLDGPYDDGPPPPRYAPRPYSQEYAPPPAAYGPPPYGPTAYAVPELPIHEIYRIVRENGYSPLGAPRQRGPVATISVIDPDGEDGRLVIDARSGRILRFIPADRYGARGFEAVPVAYGPPPPLGMSRPPALRPAVAPQPRSAVPVPKPRVAAAQPLPDKSSAAGQRPLDAQAKIPPAPPAALAAAPPVAAAAPVAPKPAVTLQPTQAMPAVQGVD